MQNSLLRQTEAGVLVSVRVKPRSHANKVEGFKDGALMVWVRAAPVEGEANVALIETVAKFFGVSRSCLQIVKGHKGREKTICLMGCLLEDVRQRLPLL